MTGCYDAAFVRFQTGATTMADAIFVDGGLYSYLDGEHEIKEGDYLRLPNGKLFMV